MSQTLAESIAELITGKVLGTSLDDDMRDCLSSGIASGITIFKENVKSQEQVLDLCDDVRKSCRSAAFISIDQEGGPVQRLDDIISPIPSMMALAQLQDLERIKMIINLAGKQMRLLGINCVLAPVLDVNTNARNPIIGTRAFGSSPELVAKLSALVMRSYLEAGMLPVAKHFPGHGDTDLDSHLELPRLSHSRERLEEIELSPFKENLLITPAILVAHLWVECLDKETIPASLSYNVITKLLKEELGFQKLLISDDMLMKAITNKWGLEEACVRAIEAGLDLLLVCAGPTELRKVHKALMDAVNSGRISEERILQSVRARKVALNKVTQFDELEKTRRLSSLSKSVAASEQLLVETSSTAIELSRGVPRNIFLGEEPIDIFIPKIERYPLKFVESLRSEYPAIASRLVEHRYSLNPGDEEIKELSKNKIEKCILVTFRASINRTQVELANQLLSQSKDGLLIASDVPYDLDLLPDWDKAVSMFDPSDLAVRAFAKLMAKSLHICKACGH